MTTFESIIAEHPFFEGLEPKYHQLIAECAKNVRFNEGDHLFREDEPADYFYVIRHGRVALDVFRPRKGPATFATIREGEVVGWSWLFPPYKWHFDARAVVLTRALAFDAKCLRDKCDDDTKLGYDLMKRFARIMMERLNAARLQLLDIYGDND